MHGVLRCIACLTNIGEMDWMHTDLTHVLAMAPLTSKHAVKAPLVSNLTALLHLPNAGQDSMPFGVWLNLHEGRSRRVVAGQESCPIALGRVVWTPAERIIAYARPLRRRSCCAAWGTSTLHNEDDHTT